MMNEKTPILSLNKTTGRYEGWVHIEIDAEIFRRLLLQAIAEDEGDITDPQTWLGAIARVGNIQKWVGHPHARVTPVSAPPMPTTIQTVAPVATVPVPSKSEKPASTVKQLTPSDLHVSSGKLAEIEMSMSERVRHLPPYQWDNRCLTPIADISAQGKARADIGRLRYAERKVLKYLIEEYQSGNFTLEPEVAKQERQYQESQQEHLAVKLEAVAEAVNGSKFR